jgi:prepilin-type N-terminal cleavage/methylation domain-containing protein
MRQAKSERGFTLVELLVVTLIFVMVIVIAGSCFSTLLRYSSRFMKSEESDLGGVLGLEILRHDIEQAGFGLPDSYPSTGTPVFAEAAIAPANTLNDAPSGVPRALATISSLPVTQITDDAGATYTTIGTNTSLGDYLSIKASSLGTASAAQKWAYVTYSSVTTSTNPPKMWASTNANLNNGDTIIALRRSFTATGATNQLTFNQSTPATYWTTYSATGMPPAFSPNFPHEIVYLYGILSGGGNLRMPFNRADFFVATPQTSAMLPQYCAPNTGILYKAMVSQADGNMKFFPLLDCVADMHVVLGWSLLDSTGNLVTDDTQTGAGNVDTWTNADGSSVSSTSSAVTTSFVKSALADPGQIKTKLKVVKVYLLAQYGTKDTTYTSPPTFQLYNNSATAEGVIPGVTFTLSSNMLNYRWKVYRVIVRPENLYANQ